MSAHLTIRLDDIRHNVRTLAALVAPARVMLAVKADGYGHGMVPVATAALQSGADSLAVLDVPAALRLREAGIEAPLFAWLHGEETDFRAAIEADVALGVSSLVELRRVVESGADRRADVHLKIDTGLHRNGAAPEDWPALVAAALSDDRVRIAGIWSHLADASPEDDAVALGEFRAAIAVAAGLGVDIEGPDRPLLHLAASSAGIRMPEARFDLVRFGIAVYGSSPFDDQSAAELGMRAPMTMYAEVVELGDGTATVDVGWGDGLPPSVLGPSGGGAEIVIDGRRYPVIAMDVDTLTVATTDDHVVLGALAVIFGSGEYGNAPTVEDWARWAGTIGDEIMARASARLPIGYENV
jgi:alanine racemase